MNKLMETNWHRLMNQYKPTGFCMVSACRGEYSPAENKKRTAELKHDLENKGFWPIKVSGGWIENQGTEDEVAVGEDTWFVPFFFGNKNFSASQDDFFSTKTFFKWCRELGTKYEQESILYCPPNGKPRYVQTTEKDYGDGPVGIGTHTMKFDKEVIGDNDAPYFTDLSDPSKEGGYDPVEKRFKRAPRRVTFESIDFSKLYESAHGTEDVLDEPYIFDSEGQEYAWDFESMKDNIHNSSPEFWDGMEEYTDIDEFDSLKDWWQAHYDEKGLAFTYTYHSSIIDDVNDMIDDYNKSCIHYKHTPLKSIMRDDVENGEAVLVIAVDGPLIEEDKEYFEEEVLYHYRGVPVEEAYYDVESGTFIMVWKSDCLKTGAL